MRPIFAAVFGLLFLSASEVHAQVTCGPTGQMLQTVKEFGLEPLYGGASVVPPGVGILMANPEDGHWIVLLVQGDTTCILAEGAEGQMATWGTGA